MKHAAFRQPVPGVVLALVLMGTTVGRARGDIGDVVADGVLGESSFTDSVALPIGQSTFAYPRSIAIDRSVTPNRVYVSDSLYNRILGWSNVDALANGAPADIVIGQPDFDSFFCNQNPYSFYPVPPPTLASVCAPPAQGTSGALNLAVDGAGNLYVADTYNCRVLIFEDPFGTDQVADVVLGQSGGCMASSIDANHLYDPQGVSVDSAGNVYVSDTLNCRILEYDRPLATDTVPDRVYGAPDFTHRGTCNGGNDAVFFPEALSVDPNGHLWAGSIGGIYEYDVPLTKTTWDHRIGSGLCNDGGEGSATTCMAIAAVADAGGHVYVADAGNSRVLEFDSPFTINQAARVFGQPGFGGNTTLSQDACNSGGPSASSLCLQIDFPINGGAGGSFTQGAALDLDGNGNLWVADTLNHRVLRYDNPLGSDTAADLVLGHTAMNDVREPVVASPQPGFTMSYATFTRLRVDTTNSRILIEGYDRPLGVIGQADFSSSGCNTGGLSASSLCGPASAALDGPGNLWIADSGNNRVLEYQSPWYTIDSVNKQITVKHTADRVFGQPDFISNACQAGPSGLCNPYALTWDQHRELYISDRGNNRVVHHTNPYADAIGDEVIGQPDFTTTGCNNGGVSANSLCDPRGIFTRIQLTFTPTGDIYVADHGNNRVLRYNMSTSRTTAQQVFGQGGNLTTNGCSAGAGGLCGPSDVGVDVNDNLLVADTDNNRVVEFQAPVTSDTNADVVFGQPDFTSTTCNNGGTSAHSLCQPTGIFVDTSYGGEVYIADAGNQRVLRFDAPYCAEDFQLTPVTRRIRGMFSHSHPTTTMLRVIAGAAGTHSDQFKLSGGMILLENDDGPLCIMCGAQDPVMRLLTGNGVAYQGNISLLDNIRSTSNGGVYASDLRGMIDSGIQQFKITEGWFAPRIGPQFFRYAYSGHAVGLDLSGFTQSQATLRLQFGSICFDTLLQCRGTTTGRSCSPAIR